MNIKTNNQYRCVTYFCELSAKVQAEFDYLDPENDDHQDRHFIEYKGQWYDLNEFLRFEGEGLSQWDCYSADSYFSGVLCKYDPYDCERVLMATYYS
jgi:hypothetical protein